MLFFCPRIPYKREGIFRKKHQSLVATASTTITLNMKFLILALAIAAASAEEECYIDEASIPILPGSTALWQHRGALWLPTYCLALR